MLIVALGWPTLGWPTLASATSRGAPEDEVAEPEAESEPPADGETKAEPPAEGETKAEPAPTVERTPEQRRKDLLLERALEHWSEGERLYQRGSYPEAALEFESSFAAWPAAVTLYSMGLSYERAGKPVEAVRALERYLAMPDCKARPELREELACGETEQRADAEKLLVELRRRVGELVLSLGEGVRLREVRVAGRVVPLQDFPLVLVPSTVDVEVFGFEPDERRIRPVTIAGGETTTFYVAPFEPEVATPPGGKPTMDAEEDDARRVEQRRRRLRGVFWGGTGLTVASAAATAAIGGLTIYHQRRFDTKHCRNDEPDCEPSDHPYPFDHEDQFLRYKPIANALLGVTVGLAVTTALVGSFAFRKPARGRPGEAEPGARGGARSSVRPTVGWGGSGLVVRW